MVSLDITSMVKMGKLTEVVSVGAWPPPLDEDELEDCVIGVCWPLQALMASTVRTK